MISLRAGAAGICLLILAGCDTRSGPATVAYQPPPPQATPNYVTRSDFRLPEGSGCGGEIARFKAVMDNDYSTGNVNPTVHRQVMSELGPADSACASGNDGAALASLRSVKARHGYP